VTRRAISGAIHAAGAARAAGRVEGAGKAMRAAAKLPEKIADTFRGGKYKSAVLKEDMKAYRVFGGKSTLEGASEGIFLSAHEYKTSKNAKKFLALPSGNAADKISEVNIPKGTEVNIGKTEALFKKPGGGKQIFVGDKSGLNFGKTKELK
jgi:hypothetical protein